MKMIIQQVILMLAVIVLALAAVAEPIDPELAVTDANWRRIEEAGVVIEFEDDMEALARQLLPDAIRTVSDLQAVGLRAYAAFVESKEKALVLIAHQLGLPQPSTTMNDVFDEFAPHMRELTYSLTNIRLFRLCRKETLKELLISGVDMPGFSYDAASDTVTFGLGFGFSTLEHSTGEEGQPRAEFPVVVKDDYPAEHIDQAIGQLNDLIGALRMASTHTLNMIYPVVAEMALCADVGMQSAFRRWFCDGMANYIAALCLEETAGKSAAQSFLETFNTKDYQALKDQVDLLTWRAKEWDAESPSPISGDLEKAYCAFATYEICALVERHGPDIVPAILAEIAKSENSDEQTILDAIQNVTGEDFRSVLKEYGANATGHFEGLAVQNLATGISQQDHQGEYSMKKEATVIPIIPDRKHGVCVQARCAVFSPPVTARIELVRSVAPGTHTVLGVQTCELTEKYSLMTLGWGFTHDFQPGTYRVMVYFDNQLYRDMGITVVPSLTSKNEGASSGRRACAPFLRHADGQQDECYESCPAQALGKDANAHDSSYHYG